MVDLVVVSPETIEQVIRTYQRATEANWNTRSRQGSLVEIAANDVDEVMVTADLHGHRANFNRICEIADLAGHPRRFLVMQEVCHGGPTYPAGNGCMSHSLLEDVAALKSEFPEQVHFLLGNHELAELTDFPIVKSSQILNVMFRCGLMEKYGDGTEQIRRAYKRFLRSCPLAVRTPSRVFVCHSAPDKADMNAFDSTVFYRSLETIDLNPNGAAFRLLWGRDYRQANADAFARLVDADVLIHGHEPCRAGYQVPNRTQIILDSANECGTYIILPVRERLSQQEIVQQIRRLC